MIVCTNINEYKLLRDAISNKKRIGFVPTMGSLHEGHLSLIKKCKEENDICVASIFVNPIQFNNKEDLENYPRNESHDIEMLEKETCDIVFMPDVEEMYPEKLQKRYTFPGLDDVMEGAFRSGHFNGVALVLERLFSIMQPQSAYFGEKDYQQFLIVKAMAKEQFPDLQIFALPTKREKDGLAMSSRNVRLSPAERENATLIYQLMKRAKLLKDEFMPYEVKSHVQKMLVNSGFHKVEYVQIADQVTLRPIERWTDSDKARVFIAAWLGNVRLIDNMKLF